ncbi:FRE8 [Candida pseudojiufengensis]|uniref:FRE8 n=1 Tax=Candida pseudojiufengensis TaxID=497109 RepID=UPI002224B2B2|nr:FRE8 [Candida pseudojiufengensis]KAI5963744.1 FRE8 [Candida pseudojiufengensis]
MNTTNSSWFSYFHFPKGKTKEYSDLRNKTTIKYGNITTILLIIYIISIPIYNYFIIHYYRSKFHFLKRFYSKLNYYIIHDYQPNCLNASIWEKIVTNLAIIIKKIAFQILLHFSTIIQLIFWVVFLSSLSLIDIYHGDLIFLAKRLGRVCANCLPTVLFLTLRPSPLPNILYLTLIPIHKWLSRLIIVQAVIHTIIYLFYFNYSNTWFKAWKLENIYGWIALFGFLVIIFTSLSKFRARWYKTFYFCHYASTWIIVACLQFHIRPSPYTLYTIANVSILLCQIIYRLHLTRVSTKSEVKVIDVSPNLSLIEFPNNLIVKPAIAPGAHIRITNYSSNFIVRIWKQIIPNYHPYTLVSLPQDKQQKLIIRKSKFKILNNYRYLITGSFDPHLMFIHYKQPKNSSNTNFTLSKLHIDAKRVLIVVGGSAISFALPILRSMNYHGIPTKVIWVIKDFRDVLILKYFEGYIHGDDFEIFITGNDNLDQEKSLLTSKYSSNLKKRSSQPSMHYDLENEETPLLNSLTNNNQFISLNKENQIEDVDISVNSDDENYDNCSNCTQRHNNTNCNQSFSPGTFNDLDDVLDQDLESLEYEEDPITNKSNNEIDINREENEDDEDNDDEADEFEVTNQTINTTHQHHHSRKSSMNERFIPKYGTDSTDAIKSYIQSFKTITKSLKLNKKIYKGRPKLNKNYYNWCINEGFTQCSGPVMDENNNLICCKDLSKNKIIQEDLNCEKIWVISAGPSKLVENVKLWSSENGLKFHEEAFYA